MLNRTITYRAMSGVASALFLFILFLLYTKSNRQNLPVETYKNINTTLIPLEKRNNVPEVQWSLDNLNFQKLSSLNGHVVYFNFWAYWCEPCKMEIPKISEIINSLNSPNLIPILVNLDDDEKNINDAKSFIANQNWPHQSIYNQGSQFNPIFKSEALPTHIVIDKNGKVAYTFLGDILDTAEDFKQMLQHLLQEN
jgi:thiol-disulfide isomerase/thioredoxin